jgi:hypothetical protein
VERRRQRQMCIRDRSKAVTLTCSTGFFNSSKITPFTLAFWAKDMIENKLKKRNKLIFFKSIGFNYLKK